MKKMLLVIGASVALALSFGRVELEGVGAEGGEDYGFDYIITEVTPTNLGYGRLKVGYSGERGEHSIGFYGFWADEEVDPYSIQNGMSVLGRRNFSGVGGVPMNPGGTTTIAGANIGHQGYALKMGEGETMEFYYMILANFPEEEPSSWSGGRKVSYESCAKDGKYREGVICKIREEVNGVLYYDAWIGEVNYSEKVRTLGENWEEEEARRAEEERFRLEEERRLEEELRRLEEERIEEERRREEEERLRIEEERRLEEVRLEEEARRIEEERARILPVLTTADRTEATGVVQGAEDESGQVTGEVEDEDGAGKGADEEFVDESLRAPVTGGGVRILEMGWIGWAIGATLVVGRRVRLIRNKYARMKRL